MTIAPRWRKVLRDLGENPGRTSLAVLAMAAGVFGVGTILTAYSILGRELAATYRGTRPASAILFLDVDGGGDPVADAVAGAARRVPGVADAEARPVIQGRIRVGEDEWAPLALFVIRDFHDLRIDTFSREAGAWPPGGDEVLLERTALPVARAAIGDRVRVRVGGGGERRLRIAGTVHAPGLAPAWMDHVVTGFVAWGSAVRAGAPAPAEAAALRIVVAGDRLDGRHVRGVAASVEAALARQGRKVTRIDVPEPGRHPHADQMETFLFLLGAFGALTACLSAVLVANMIHALLVEQVRQVGVMKTIGASTAQIVGLYLGQVAVLAAVSLCIGMPLGLWAGRGYARFATTMLNAELRSGAVPAWVFALQVAAGVLVPLVVALGPAFLASRITIHQAFSQGAGQPPFGRRRLERWLARSRWLPRPWMLSLRTTLRRRGRLALTVGTLAAGGAVFVAAQSVAAAWSRALAEDSRARAYDVDVRLVAPFPVSRLAAAVTAVPGIARAEYWSEATAILAGASGPRDARDSGGARVRLVGPDEGTRLLRLPLLQGRWLTAGDAAGAVINQALLALDPALRVGRPIVLRVGGRTVSWTVVGVVKELGQPPTAYAPPAAVRGVIGQPGGAIGQPGSAIGKPGSTLGQPGGAAVGKPGDALPQPGGETTRSVRVVSRRHDGAAQLTVSRDLERALASAGAGVSGMQRLLERRQALADHLVILHSALLLATALVVIVGSLGLASTLMLDVVERTREIGILSAIGAGPRAISRLVVFEGVVIGVLSWGVAIVAALPVTAALEAVAGRIFIKTPLDFFLSPRAAGEWLALVVILAALSSFLPAWRAARLTVREALAYA